MTFSFANAFNRFFALLGSNFVPFAIIGLLGIIAPQVVLNYGMYSVLGFNRVDWTEKIQTLTPENWMYSGGGFFVLILLNLLALSALTEVAILRAVGKKLDAGAILGHALMNAIPMIIISIGVGLLEGLGFILLIVPGIIWSLCCCVAIPAYVGDRAVGIFGAIGKSFHLTRNHRWQLCLLFVVVYLAAGLAGGAISAFGFAMPGGVTGLASGLVQAFGNGLSALILNIFVASVYVSLRESKEIVNPDTTAKVFD